MSKYGLQLRVAPSQPKKQPTRPPLSNPLGFDEDDDDNVEREILRQAQKSKSARDIEEQQKKALEEDPLVFDYDGVYDKMKEKQVMPAAQDRQDRKPKYIQKLMEKAKQREREHEIIYERKIAKERSKDEHLYADKDKFVTSAYKKKLAEQAKWAEEERLREAREQKDDVTKKADISDFYFNLSKNVAFGGGNAGSQNHEKQHEEAVTQSPEYGPPPPSNTTSESSTMMRRHVTDPATDLSPEAKFKEASARPNSDTASDLSPNEKSKEVSVRPISDAPEQDQAADKPSASDKPQPDHHKRSQDAVAAAKERFLARKRAKE